MRCTDLQKAIPSISRRMLALTLRRDRLVTWPGDHHREIQGNRAQFDSGFAVHTLVAAIPEANATRKNAVAVIS